MALARILSPEQGSSLIRLDPRTLGRPHHLLPDFVRALQTELSAFLDETLNRRYRAALAVPGQADAMDAGWFWLKLDGCALALQLPRPLLLALLDYRFGAPRAAPPDALPPVSDTERRLERALAARLTPLVWRQLAREDAPQPAEAQPAGIAWQTGFALVDGDLPLGALGVALDAAAFERLLAGLSRPASACKQDAEPLSQRLPLKLEARLWQQRLPLASLLELKPGAVLPLGCVPRSQVLVNGQALFEAGVSQRSGRLCLSGFAAVDANHPSPSVGA